MRGTILRIRSFSRLEFGEIRAAKAAAEKLKLGITNLVIIGRRLIAAELSQHGINVDWHPSND